MIVSVGQVWEWQGKLVLIVGDVTDRTYPAHRALILTEHRLPRSVITLPDDLVTRGKLLASSASSADV